MYQLEIRYTPEKGIIFRKFRGNQEIEISYDSVLTFYMNQGSGFVMQEQGEKFMKSLAEAFNGYKHVQIEVIMSENDFKYLKELYEEYADKTQFEVPVLKNQQFLDEIKNHAGKAVSELRSQRQTIQKLLIKNKSFNSEIRSICQEITVQINQIQKISVSQQTNAALLSKQITQILTELKNKIKLLLSET